MILENTSKLSHGQVWQGRPDCLESCIIGGEDGHVAERVDGIDEVRFSEGTGYATKPCSNCCAGDVLRDCQHGVYDVDDASGKVLILFQCIN